MWSKWVHGVYISAAKQLIVINRIQKFLFTKYMCVCCVYLLCIYKYKQTHACIYLRKIYYVYIKYIYI